MAIPRAIVLNPADNVATLLDAARAGEPLSLQGEGSGQLTLAQDVGFGHKVCIADTAAGATVLKYGQAIGKATRAIKVGEHVHVHNLESGRRSKLARE
jgi:altronate dehydratase small subunit